MQCATWACGTVAARFKSGRALLEIAQHYVNELVAVELTVTINVRLHEQIVDLLCVTQNKQESVIVKNKD